MLQGKVSISETRVQECAKYEVENQVMSKKIEVFEQEVATLTENLSRA